MKGRGVRVLSSDELRGVTPDAQTKDRFVIVDAVGVTDHPMIEARPLERQPYVPLHKLLEAVALGATDKDRVISFLVMKGFDVYVTPVCTNSFAR